MTPSRKPTTFPHSPSLEQAFFERCEQHTVNVARAWGQVFIRADGNVLTVLQGANTPERYDPSPQETAGERRTRSQDRPEG